MFKFIFVAALIVCVVAEGEHHHSKGEDHHHAKEEDHHHAKEEDHHGKGEDHHAETKLWKTEFGHDGWLSEFETTNHIRQAAHGDKHGNVEGDFEWVDPHGEHAAIHYKADEHGYHPEGEIIPTPHPIPKEILKALEYIKAHPYHEDEEHHDHHHEEHHEDHHDHHHEDHHDHHHEDHHDHHHDHH